MITGDDEDPFLILKTIPELGHVFATKEWAPIMLCFEVIKFKEAKEHKGLLLKSSKELKKILSSTKIQDEDLKKQEKEELKEDLKIDVENHMKVDDGLNLEHTDPSALKNNPFLVDADE